jgi:hypothetical protein
VSEETEKEQHANSTYQQVGYETHQEEDVDKTYLDFDVKRLRVSEETEEEQHADSTCQQAMCETYEEEDVDKNYPEKTAERGNTTNDGPLNKGVPRETGAIDIARRSTVSKAASEKGEPDVKVVPGATALMKKEPNVRETLRSIDVPGAVTAYKYEQTNGMADKMETERNAITATTPDEGGTGGHN